MPLAQHDTQGGVFCPSRTSLRSADLLAVLDSLSQRVVAGHRTKNNAVAIILDLLPILGFRPFRSFIKVFISQTAYLGIS